jgi:hypothetical protein
MRDSGPRIDALAERRGWPDSWVDILCDLGIVSWPDLPWSGKRYPAFRVDMPDGTPVGYHQRIWTEEDGPAWLFVPYAPAVASSVFTGKLRDYAAGRGDGRLVQPFPFVLGKPANAEVWIITEGQWDAITVYGALGGFDDSFDLPLAVFGLRGAKGGPGMFLSAYGPLLRKVRPRLWLMPDNDPASRWWDSVSQWDAQGRPVPLSFTDRIRKFVGDRAVIQVTRVDSAYGKDFNDYWRAKRPTRHVILQTMQALWKQPQD